jgi:RNA polymerase sigma-70 factor (ECF subfamily)
VGITLFKQAFEHKTDEELMVFVTKNGTEKAFEELYNRYAKKLLWFSLRLVNDKELAADIVQDTFIKMIDKPAAFDGTQKFSTWIYTLVNNASLNAIKNKENRGRLLEENYFQVNTSHLTSTIDAKKIQQKINSLYKVLSQQEQAVFVLRFEHNLNLKEIAKIIEVPEGTVKSCLYYLLKKMSQQLKAFQTTD